MTHDQPEMIPFSLKRRAGPCLLCGQKALAWTSAPPTELGFYWWRHGPGKKPRVVELRRAANGELVEGIDPLVDEGQWAGQLTPPPG